MDEVVDGEEKSCSPESSGRAGRRLARLETLDGVVGLLLLRLRTGSRGFNGDRRLKSVRTMGEIGERC